MYASHLDFFFELLIHILGGGAHFSVQLLFLS